MRTLFWKNNNLYIIDQTKLPLKLTVKKLKNYPDVIKAIKTMQIRGAPAIGVAAAFGLALAAIKYRGKNLKRFIKLLKKAGSEIVGSRPTAVNIFWAVSRMLKKIIESREESVSRIKRMIIKEAINILNEDISINKKIGAVGARIVKGRNILTHCNAGSLAIAGYGTALGVIRSIHRKNKKIKVYATETRPLLQGARLTCFELKKDGINTTLITDGMAGSLIYKGMIDAVVVGADRIAKNGDVANKIGTYQIAVLAKENKIPFYVAAPTSTIDMSISSGEQIKIEQRPPEEVLEINNKRIAPVGIKVLNPAFDVTPNRYISGIITEKGLFKNGRYYMR